MDGAGSGCVGADEEIFKDAISVDVRRGEVGHVDVVVVHESSDAFNEGGRALFLAYINKSNHH